MDTHHNLSSIGTCEKRPATDRSDKESHTPDKSVRFATIPYIKGVSEKVKKTLNKVNIKTAFKPMRTLGHIFKKPKDRHYYNWQKKGIVYKVKCKSCEFTYVGESKRSWNSRGKEHKPGTCPECFSAIKQHAETTDNDIQPKYVELKEIGVTNLSQRLFLESWHSQADKNSTNESKAIPKRVQVFCKASLILISNFLLSFVLCFLTLYFHSSDEGRRSG